MDRITESITLHEERNNIEEVKEMIQDAYKGTEEHELVQDLNDKHFEPDGIFSEINNKAEENICYETFIEAWNELKEEIE